MTEYNISNRSSHWSNDTFSPWETIEVIKLRRKYWKTQPFAESVFICLISVVEIPIMLLTLYALCFLIKSHRAASVFVIQLILSDLIQIICLILSTWEWTSVLWDAYNYILMTGLYFMSCIAFERYLLVAHPIWHKTHQTLKFSFLISLIIWFLPLVFATIDPPYLYFNPFHLSIAFLIPYPIIILSFVGTWRGLSHSISLTTQKRRMILGSLFLVLLSYTFIILPYSIVTLVMSEILSFSLQKANNFMICLLYLNPLSDCLLYLFMRTDAADIMPSLHCCCTSDTQQILVTYTTRSS